VHRYIVRAKKHPPTGDAGASLALSWRALAKPV